jgi:hypothetical protein
MSIRLWRGLRISCCRGIWSDGLDGGVWDLSERSGYVCVTTVGGGLDTGIQKSVRIEERYDTLLFAYAYSTAFFNRVKVTP